MEESLIAIVGLHQSPFHFFAPDLDRGHVAVDELAITRGQRSHVMVFDNRDRNSQLLARHTLKAVIAKWRTIKAIAAPHCSLVRRAATTNFTPLRCGRVPQHTALGWPAHSPPAIF